MKTPAGPRRRRPPPSRAAIAWRRTGGIALLLFVAVGIVTAQAILGTAKHGATLTHVSFHSRFTGHTERLTLIEPENGADRPLLVLLHGHNSTEDTNANSDFFAALAKQGARAPAIVMPGDDGDSYWHNRATGHWAAYVMDEVIPKALSALHADRTRIAIGGISMGGFGALNLARLYPTHFCAAGGHSPALWRTGGETAPGAFDDAQDFARNDVIGVARSDPGAWGHMPLWLDAGTGDPFDPGDRAFIAAMRAGHRAITVHRWPGGHVASYWHAHYAEYLAFYARALARC